MTALSCSRPSNAVVPKAHSGSGHDDVRAHPNVRSLKIRSLKLPVRFRPQIGHDRFKPSQCPLLADIVEKLGQLTVHRAVSAVSPARMIGYLPRTFAQGIAFWPLLCGNDAVWRPWWSEFRQSPQVLGGCCKQEFVSRTTWTSQPQTRHPENAFEVSEEHLDLLAAMSGTLVSGCGGNRSGDIAGIFVEITRHLARRRIRAAALFEFAGVAVLFAGAIEPRPFTRYPRSGRCIGSVELLQLFACWADVAIILAIPGEVRTREGPVRPVRFIKDRNVRRDAPFP